MNRDLYADRGAQQLADLIYEMLSGGQRAARGELSALVKRKKSASAEKRNTPVSGLCGEMPGK